MWIDVVPSWFPGSSGIWKPFKPFLKTGNPWGKNFNKLKPNVRASKIPWKWLPLFQRCWTQIRSSSKISYPVSSLLGLGKEINAQGIAVEASQGDELPAETQLGLGSRLGHRHGAVAQLAPTGHPVNLKLADWETDRWSLQVLLRI